MEIPAKPEAINKPHTLEEFQNLWVCQKIIRDWTDNPQWDSYDVLPVLYQALHTGDKNLPGTDSGPKLAQTVRNSTSFLPGSPANLLAPSENVYILASRYSSELDRILREKPKNLSKAIEDAAFAYYVFDRIHPFPDGNGRIGRMIIKRVFKSAGVKDPVFHDPGWYGGGRSEHKLALERVDETNDLAHLELFLAESLTGVYDPLRELFKHREISRFISSKQKLVNQQANSRLLSNIWEGFVGLPMYGNQFPI